LKIFSKKGKQLRGKSNNRLSIIVFISLAFGFSLTSFLSYITTRDIVISSALTQSLPLINDNIYSEIKQEIIDPISVSSMMANDAFLIDWVNSGEKDLDAIKNYLELIKQKYGFTSTFFVSDKTRNYYYSNGILKKISEDDPHDVWYFNFKDLNTPVDLDIDNDEAKSGLLTIFINHRFEDTSGNFIGATGVGLEFTEISEKLRKYENQYLHKIYLVDRNGLIQIHPEEEVVEKANINELEGIREISEEILTPSEEIWVGEYNDTHGKKAISVRHIQEFDWFLIVEKDENESLAIARTTLITNFGIGSATAVCVSLLIYFAVKRFNQQLNYLASSDELTKTHNRRSFIPQLRKEISRSISKQYSASLLMIDIDDFKSVNDKHGHFIGDDLLIKVVKTIQESIRTKDIIVRWGGDEFCVYLFNADLQTALKIAKRIQVSIKNVEVTDDTGDSIYRTVSIGIATLSDPKISAEELIKNADDALINAKKEKKNSIGIFSAS